MTLGASESIFPSDALSIRPSDSVRPSDDPIRSSNQQRRNRSIHLHHLPTNHLPRPDEYEQVDKISLETVTPSTPFLVSLIAGGLAGTSVDVALFPIDTIKTRLQSPQGFLAAGGFRGIYRGLGAAAAGSAPGAALFFSTYETLKPHVLSAQNQLGILSTNPALSHMISASCGEAAACLVRVPTEVIKSKMQTNAAGSRTVLSTFQLVLTEQSGNAILTQLFGGLYRGFGITLLREIPFALIQFPIYERAKIEWSKYQNRDVSPLQAAACGSLGGGIAAAFTTPLDVVKTRMMLGVDKDGVSYKGLTDVIARVSKEEGGSIFLKGIQPRVMWISIGGFVFFGAYEGFRALLLST